MLLLSAAEIESVEYNPSSRLFTSLVLCEGCDFVEVVFAEGSASLEERVGADGRPYFACSDQADSQVVYAKEDTYVRFGKAYQAVHRFGQ